MKKVVLTFVVMLASIITLFASPKNEREFILKFGIQPLNGSFISSKDSSETTHTGISVGLEYFKYLSNIVAFGSGAQYYLPRKQSNTVDGSPEFSFMPLFTALKLRTHLDNTLIFLSGRLGCTIPMISKLPAYLVSSKVGLYYGLVIGISRKFLVIELISERNSFSLQKTNEDSGNLKIDLSFDTLAFFSVGYKFDL